MKNTYFIVLLILFVLTACNESSKQVQVPENQAVNTDTVLVFDTQKAILTFTLQGSSIIDFRLKDNAVNPFTWSLTREQMPKNNRRFEFKGHFLCSGRWGSPSPEEKEIPIPHNGEVNTELWRIEQPITNENGILKAITFCESPIEKLDVRRYVTMPIGTSYFMVKEEVTNKLPIGRPFNFVQHATVAAPFLSKSTLIDTNADWGFNQKDGTDSLELNPFRWPNGLDKGKKVNLRVTNETASYVTTHIFPDNTEYGWLTATSPETGLLLGYLWKTADYPFINVWNQKNEEGTPVALGLEFGTTGKGIEYKTLLERGGGKFKGHLSFQYIEPNETKTYSYQAFLTAIPADFKGVKSIEITEKGLLLHEYGDKGRTLTVAKNIGS